MAMQRINILGVPVDLCPPENMESEILAILAKPGTKQIVFLSVWDLLRARGKHNDFGQCVKTADMVLPVSKSILQGARMLGLPVPVRYNPFTAVIHVLSVLDQHYKTVYLFGGHKKTLQQAEHNVKATFPNLQVVGRYVGYYPRTVENDIVAAMYKASPSLVLVSEGIKEKDCWSYHRRNRFSSSIFLYYRDALGIFAERIKRVNEKTFERGHEFIFEVIHNPLKILFVFPYFQYILIIVWNRVFRKTAG
jgi:N-acetylglucosaminyldiphosphoundecaprenol N-acetyl-beta-D-mannosaminyltransferase